MSGDTSRGERARRRRSAAREQRIRRFAFLGSLGALTLAIPVLGWFGYRTLLDSRGGRVVAPTTIPSGELNQESDVVPTPVALLVSGDDDHLAGVTLLVIGEGDAGGAVVYVPARTTVPPNTFGITDLTGGFVLNSIDGVSGFVANALGTGIGEALLVDADLWSQLVAPVAPLTLENPSEVILEREDAEPAVLPAGPVTLEAADAFGYLAFETEGEPVAAQAARHRAFWQAWLSAVAASPDGAAVPGEGSTGVSRFVRALARGDVEYEPLPGVDSGDGTGSFVPDTTAIGRLVTDLIAFPTAANPGDRVRVRLLDGSGREAVRDGVGRLLVAAGAQLTVVGTADSFDHDETRVLFGVGVDETAAEALRDAIGTGEVVAAPAAAETYDVTVIVGRDVADDVEP